MGLRQMRAAGTVNLGRHQFRHTGRAWAREVLQTPMVRPATAHMTKVDEVNMAKEGRTDLLVIEDMTMGMDMGRKEVNLGRKPSLLADRCSPIQVARSMRRGKLHLRALVQKD